MPDSSPILMKQLLERNKNQIVNLYLKAGKARLVKQEQNNTDV